LSDDSLDLPETAETRGFGSSGTGVPQGETEALETRMTGAAEVVRTLAAEVPAAERPTAGAIPGVPGVPETRQRIRQAQAR
jgi:hypothetical protein